jgi:hypothetical protein
MKTEIAFDNGSMVTIDLDPSTFRKVSIDQGRTYDTRVRVVFIDQPNPVDMFFRKSGAPVPPCPIGPMVTKVTFYAMKGPASFNMPEPLYEILSHWFIMGHETDVTMWTSCDTVDLEGQVDNDGPGMKLNE